MKVIFFFLNLGIFISDLGKNTSFFALGIGAEYRPQNQPRKSPDRFL